MVDVAEEIIPSACQEVQKAEETTRKSMEATGVRFETLQPEIGAKFKDLMKGVANTWASGLDSRGKRGSDALKEFDAAVTAVPVK
jgi:TRAP-type C4-dicarboxylate transport system substrate-binding protein